MCTNTNILSYKSFITYLYILINVFPHLLIYSVECGYTLIWWVVLDSIGDWIDCYGELFGLDYYLEVLRWVPDIWPLVKIICE